MRHISKERCQMRVSLFLMLSGVLKSKQTTESEKSVSEKAKKLSAELLSKRAAVAVRAHIFKQLVAKVSVFSNILHSLLGQCKERNSGTYIRIAYNYFVESKTVCS